MTTKKFTGGRTGSYDDKKDHSAGQQASHDAKKQDSSYRCQPRAEMTAGDARKALKEFKERFGDLLQIND